MSLAALSRSRLLLRPSLLSRSRFCSTASLSPYSTDPCKYAATCKTSQCPAAVALRAALSETGVMSKEEAGRKVDGTTVLVVLAGLSSLVLLWTSPAEVHEAFEKPPRAAFRSHSLDPPTPFIPFGLSSPYRPKPTPSGSETWDEALLRFAGVGTVVKVLGMLQPADPAIGVFKEWQTGPARRKEA